MNCFKLITDNSYFFVSGYYDDDIISSSVESEINGLGIQNNFIQNITREKQIFLCFLYDEQLKFLTKISQAESITIVDLTYQQVIETSRTSFTSQSDGNKNHTGVLTFTVCNNKITNCCDLSCFNRAAELIECKCYELVADTIDFDNGDWIGLLSAFAIDEFQLSVGFTPTGNSQAIAVGNQLADFVNMCMDMGSTVQIEIADVSGGNHSFEATSVQSIDDVATQYVFNGFAQSTFPFSNRFNTLTATCQIETTGIQEACRYEFCDGAQKWINSATGLELTQAEIDLLTACPSEVCEISLSSTTNTNCNYTIELENPTDGTNTMQLSVNDGDEFLTAASRCLVNNSCQSGFDLFELIEQPVELRMRYRDTTNLNNGAFLNTIRVYENSTGVATDIDMTNTAFQTGVAGTVNGSDLIFNTSTAANWAASVKIVIENAINQLLSLTNNDYNLTVSAANNGIFDIRFITRHLVNLPATNWVGINGNDSLIQYTVNGSLVIGQLSRTAAAIAHTCTYDTECNTLDITRSPVVNSGTNSSVWNYNNMTVTDPKPAMSGTGGNLTDNCDQTCITATLSDCTPTSIEWTLDGTTLTGETGNEVCGYGSGTYQIAVTLADNSVITETTTI